jgi:hypothetical protein
MGEHDDELEVSPSAGAVHNDAARVTAAIAEGLQRIATVLERGWTKLVRVVASTGDDVRRHARSHRESIGHR